VHISTFTLDSSYYDVLLDAAHFTTIGPVMIDSSSFHELIPNSIYTLELYLRNDGLVASATNVRVKVETADTDVTNIANFTNQSFGNIEPAQIKGSIVASITTQDNPNNIDFNVHISSENWDLWSDSVTAVITGITKSETNIPLEYTLKQNYPNPFNPTTTIEFDLPYSEFVTLKIYNILGEEVSTLVSKKLAVGNYKYEWDSSSLASGVYLYRLEAGDFVESKKMILLR
jgi:hypothetical protein